MSRLQHIIREIARSKKFKCICVVSQMMPTMLVAEFGVLGLAVLIVSVAEKQF